MLLRSLVLAILAVVVGIVTAACGGSPGTAVAPTLTPRPTFTRTPDIPTPTNTPSVTPSPTAVPPTATPTPNPNINPLTGVVVTDTAILQRRPIQVCINNMPVARPQYGLAQADIVYEYVMDGWAVTRFTAIYLGQEAGRIGPVRSARLINLHLGPMYDSALVASGASIEVRWLLRNKGVYPYLDIDLDDSSNTSYSTSIGTHWETRLQTSTSALRRWLQKIGKERPVSVKPLAFSTQTPSSPSGLGKSLHVPYPASSVADWVYNASTERYLRSVEGVAHGDGATGKQLDADNVVVIYAQHGKTSIIEDSLGDTSIQIGLAGEGRCILLREGQAWECTWSWDAPLDAATVATGDTVIVPGPTDKPLVLVGTDGKALSLKPGRTWFEVVPTDYRVAVR